MRQHPYMLQQAHGTKRLKSQHSSTSFRFHNFNRRRSPTARIPPSDFSDILVQTSFQGMNNHAIDILELFDKSWFGFERVRSPESWSVSSSESASTRQHQRHPPAPCVGTLGEGNQLPPSQRLILQRNACNISENSINGNMNPSVFAWNHQAPPPTPPIPARSCRSNSPEMTKDQRQAQILQELPGIGTWAGRQRLFNIKPMPVTLTLTTSIGQVDDDDNDDSFGGDDIALLEPPSLVSTSFPVDNSPHGDELSYKLVMRNSKSLDDKHRLLISQPKALTTTTPDTEDNYIDAGVISKQAAHHTTHPRSSITPHMNLSEQHTQRPYKNPSNTNDNLIMTKQPLERSASNTSSEARRMHEAWRWRFTRRWDAERRAVEAMDPSMLMAQSGDDDLGPIQYLQACGMGLDLQVTETRHESHRRGIHRHGRGRKLAVTPSASGRGANDASSLSTVTMQLEPSFVSVGELLLATEDSGSVVSSFLATPEHQTLNPTDCSSTATMNATHDLLRVATRGKELLRFQQEIENEAEAKWMDIENNSKRGNHESSSSTWVGAFLSAVEIDMQNTFSFVVLRVTEIGPTMHASRQKLLVRGRQGYSPQDLIEETCSHTTTLCAKHSLPNVRVAAVGGGTMEWAQDTHRHVYLSAHPLNPIPSKGMISLSGPPPAGKAWYFHDNTYVDVCGLAASLLRQTLPYHFQIRVKP